MTTNSSYSGKLFAFPDHETPGSVLLVTTCWWPSLAQFVHLLIQGGCQVSLLCPTGHAGRMVPGVRIFEQDAFRPQRALSAAIAGAKPAMVVPGDDRAVAHLHELHRVGTNEQRDLVERSLGPPSSYSTTTSRTGLVALSRKLNIIVPNDNSIASREDLDAWLTAQAPPWVLKVDGAWGGHGVRIVSTTMEAHAAYHELTHQSRRALALKRWVINRDPSLVSDWLQKGRPRMSVQTYIRGRPGDLAMFCCKGEVLSATIAEAVAYRGSNGPSTIVRLVQRPDFVAGARRLARKLELTGFYGIDFMVEEATNRPVLIEMNPRVTPLSNIRLDVKRDLIGAAATLLTGQSAPSPRMAPTGDLVAHFPAAWTINPDDVRLVECFHEIPWSEPILMEEMLRPSWPERSLLARLTTKTKRLLQQGHHQGALTVENLG